VILTAMGTVLAMVILGLAVGVIGVIIGATVPFLVRWYIRSRIARKRRLFAEQLPDNLDVLASALRAGHSLVSALNVVADDAPEPSKSEFKRVLAEEQFGVNLEDAFKVVVDRMANQDLDQVALVARLQREVGSNSAEVLDRVIETVRARMELRRLVRVLTAQGRLSRWILTLLPVLLLVFMLLAGGNYMQPLLHATLGKALLVIAAIMVATGSWVIGKIVDIKV
jgi:tight adherence protein B